MVADGINVLWSRRKVSHDRDQTLSSELAKSYPDVWTEPFSPFSCTACLIDNPTYDIVPTRSLPPPPFTNPSKKRSIPIRDFNEANQTPNLSTEPLYGAHVKSMITSL